MIIEVGKKLFHDKTRYQEGAMFEYTEAGPMLVLAFNNPTLTLEELS